MIDNSTIVELIGENDRLRNKVQMLKHMQYVFSLAWFLLGMLAVPTVYLLYKTFTN